MLHLERSKKVHNPKKFQKLIHFSQSITRVVAEAHLTEHLTQVIFVRWDGLVSQ
jgi:hypothetical protein